ncbi:hypothetical protein D3C81_2234990 [compost metagenome]
MQQSPAIDTGRISDYVDPPREAPRSKSTCTVGIAEDVRIIKAPLAVQPFGIDSQPAGWAEIEHIAMVDVPM